MHNAVSKEIYTGTTTNVYTATCKGNELTLEINGIQVAAIPTRYDFPEGKIGIGFSCLKKITC